jgi:pimeloyl-ACP methyl ester carboxylesterase
MTVATFGLIPVLRRRHWHRSCPGCGRGHDVVAVDLPAADDAAGLAEYPDAVVEAIGDRTDLVLVAQSLGGFTAPLVCDRTSVELLVLLNAMVPLPGETAGDWWSDTGQAEARARHAAAEGRSCRRVRPRTVLHDVTPTSRAA